MSVLFSLLSVLYTVFLHVNSFTSGTAYETAEYFASYDRNVDSWENVELFESLGNELDLEMERVVHYASVPSFWSTLTIDEEQFDGVSYFVLEDGFKGELIHMNWDQSIKDLKGKIAVLPMTDESLKLEMSDTSADPYGEVLVDLKANRYLMELAKAGAEGYIITPHEQYTVERLSNEAMQEHVDWLVEWLKTQ